MLNLVGGLVTDLWVTFRDKARQYTTLRGTLMTRFILISNSLMQVPHEYHVDRTHNGHKMFPLILLQPMKPNGYWCHKLKP